jgi:hypothetical protein
MFVLLLLEFPNHSNFREDGGGSEVPFRERRRHVEKERV